LSGQRLVFDTNTVVSALLFRSGRLAWLRSEWRTARMVPLVSKATVLELVRVLSYPKFELSEVEQEELLGEYLPFAEVVQVSGRLDLPNCRDEADQMFLEVAAAGNAGALVTGDSDLLAMVDDLPFEVITPSELGEGHDRGPAGEG
jgi:putative PIN family toxin of toxin-antitoxin system